VKAEERAEGKLKVSS